MRAGRVIFWSVGTASGLYQAWSQRFWMEPDGLNYLDIASAYARHDWAAAINSYWSPLYSWLLAMVLRIFHPKGYWESTALHALNFAIFMAALACGEFFLSELIARRREDGLPEWALWSIGYSLLLFVSLFLISVYLDTPDLLTSALVYLATGLLIRIRSRQAGARIFAVFGMVLGVAYLAKTVMFLVAFAFLAAAGLKKGTALAAACFAAVSAPWIVALTHATGHATYGDAGSLNYVIYVANSGAPVHAPREIFVDPDVREFAEPVRATYPPWYNPPYWMEGLRPRFDWREQLRVLGRSAREYLHSLWGQKEYAIAFVALLAANRGKLKARWRLALPAAFGMGLYALVHVEPRLVGAFFVVLWMALFAGLGAASGRIVVAATLLVVAATGVKLVKAAALESAHVSNVQWEAAHELQRAGVPPGSSVAYFGQTTEADYWARLGGFKIVADIRNEDMERFWTAPESVRKEILRRVTAIGACAVVAKECPAGTWERLGKTVYCMKLAEK